MNDSNQEIKFRYHPPSEADGEHKFEVVDSAEEIIGTAHVQLIEDSQESFWDLKDIYIIEESNRGQGYGTQLLNYIKQFLWSIKKLRIRVYPGAGVQIMDSIAEEVNAIQMKQKLTKEEKEAKFRKLQQEKNKPGFWEKYEQTSKTYDSERLIKWYKRQGFAADSPDEKYLWCRP